jgi:hypothetical protein
VSRCRACGAELAWARTEANGKLMPLDPGPSPAGNVALRRGDVGGALVAVAEVLAGAELEQVRGAGEVPLYVPHFATCPGWPARRRRPARPRRGDVEVVDLQQVRARPGVAERAR